MAAVVDKEEDWQAAAELAADRWEEVERLRRQIREMRWWQLTEKKENDGTAAAAALRGLQGEGAGGWGTGTVGREEVERGLLRGEMEGVEKVIAALQHRVVAAEEGMAVWRDRAAGGGAGGMGAGWEEVTRLRVEIRKWEVWYEREKEDGRDVPGGWRREGLLHRAERAVGMGGLLKREVDRRWEIEGVHRRLKRKAREWNKNRKELARRMVGFRGQVEELRERVEDMQQCMPWKMMDVVERAAWEVEVWRGEVAQMEDEMEEVLDEVDDGWWDWGEKEDRWYASKEVLVGELKEVEGALEKLRYEQKVKGWEVQKEQQVRSKEKKKKGRTR